MSTPLTSSTFRNRVVGLVIGSTILLTVALLGVVEIVTEPAPGYASRVPIYVLGGSILFIVLVFQFERRHFDGRTIILATTGLAIVGTFLFFLIGEGVVYGVSHPDEILATHLVLYLLSIGVCCTGLAHWGLNHWREFVTH